MRISLLIIMLACLFAGCFKDPICGCAPPYDIYYFKAKVVTSADPNCNKPVLDFTEDTMHLRVAAGLTATQYVVTGLNPVLGTTGNTLFVQMGAFAAGEDFTCTSSLPHMKITDTKQR